MSLDKLRKNDVALIGILSDGNSSFMQGTAAAPAVIRRVLHCGSSNLCSELGVELVDNPRFVDIGDREIAHDTESFLTIEGECKEV